MTIRFWGSALLALTVLSCTQEHLILLMNLQRANLINPEQMIRESGLETPRPELLKPEDREKPARKTPPPVAVETPVTNIRNRVSVLPGGNFSVTVSPDSNTVALKSLQGGIEYLPEQSDPARGTFVFRAGTNDGSIHMQSVGSDGKVRKNLYYSVALQAPVKEPPATNELKKTAKTPPLETNAVTAPTPNLSQMIVSATEGLSPTEAGRELQKMMNSPTMTDADREIIRYKMLDILIEERSFSRVESEISQIRNERKKDLYQGRYLTAKNNGKEAVRSYLAALGGDDETRKAAIRELEQVVIGLGAVDKGLIATLVAETKKYRANPEFYGDSMIAIARIYQSVPDVYAARDILQSLMQPEWPETVRAKAQAAYDELQREFLNYR